MVGAAVMAVAVISLAAMIAGIVRPIALPLLVGASLRVGVALLGWHAITLPYSTGDAIGFERGAWRMAEAGWPTILDALNPLTGFSYIAPFAAIYALVGRAPHALLAYNAILSLLTIFLVYRIGLALGGRRVGIGSAWVMAIFPAAILMSAVILREAAVGFGVALGMFGLLEASRKNNPAYIFVGVFGLAWAALHHGGMLFPALVGLVAFAVTLLRGTVGTNRVHLPSIAVSAGAIVVLVGAAAVVAPGNLRLASAGVINFETVEREILAESPRVERGGSSYYGGTTTESWGQALRQLPGRVTLFMVSPLPWTVRSASQVAGLLDGLIWGVILLLLFRHRRVVWANPAARTLLLFLAIGVTTYALGTTNAGTALRHRTKFAPALIPLVLFAVLSLRTQLARKDRKDSRSQTGQEDERVQGPKVPLEV